MVEVPEGTVPSDSSDDSVVDWTEVTLTSKCNQRCFFCYEEARDNSQDPTTEETRALLRQTAEHAEQVVFCGREALLRTDILDLVEYADSLGLRSVVFTNGQRLSKDGLIEALAEKGCASIAVSFHFPDEEVFERAARVKPKGFQMILDGLRKLRDYNLAHPEKPIPVSTEMDMFALNAGRLAEMRDTLMRVLHGAPWRMRVASLTPTRVYDIGIGKLLVSMEERRRELLDFVRTQPDDVPLGFVKLPLCLLPEGEEQRSLDVHYVHEGTVLTFNHEEPERITADAHSCSSGRDVMGILRTSPYRWVCRRCQLLSLCRFERSDWREAGFEPDRGQRPTPYLAPDEEVPLFERLGIEVRRATAADLFARLDDETKGMPHVEAVRAQAAQSAFPEEDILAALLERGPGEPALVDAWAEGAPGVVLVFEHEGTRVTLHLGFPQQEAGASFAVGYLAARALDADPDTAALQACVARLRAIPLPAIERWGDTASDAPSTDSDRGPALRVEVSDPEGASVCYFLGRAQPGESYLHTTGDIALWYQQGDLPPFAQTVAKILRAAMKHLQDSPPSADTAARWQRALEELAARVRLRDGYDWQIAWRDR